MTTFYQYAIDVKRIDSLYMTESAMIDIYLEGTSDNETLGSKIKNAIKKIVELFKQFCRNLAHAISNIMTQANLRMKLMHIKDTIYMQPKLKDLTLSVYFDPGYRTDYNKFVSTMKNVLTMGKLKTEDTQTYNYMHAIDMQRNNWGKKKTMTVSQMITMIDEELNLLQKDLKETLDDLIHFSTLRDYSKEGDVRTFESVSNFLKDRNRVHCDHVMENTNNLFGTVKRSIGETLRRGSQLVTIKKNNLNPKSGLSSANKARGLKPVSSITIDGKKIDIYRSNGKIQSGDSAGASIIKSSDSFEYITVADDFFTELSKEEQTAVLYHEYAHYKNGEAGNNGKLTDLSKSVSTVKKLENSSKVENLPGAKESKILYLFYELEADKTAIKMGASKQALNNAIDKMDKNFSDNGKQLQETRKSLR